MIGRILIGIYVSFCFVEPTLKAAIILANLIEARKIQENWHHICSVKNLAFSFKHFYGKVRILCRLSYFEVLVSFITVSLLTWEKWKLDKLLTVHLKVLILGWFLYFRISFKDGCLETLWWSAFTWCSGILRFLTISEKKPFKVLPTSFPLEIIFTFSINRYFQLIYIQDKFFEDKVSLSRAKTSIIIKS